MVCLLVVDILVKFFFWLEERDVLIELFFFFINGFWDMGFIMIMRLKLECES